MISRTINIALAATRLLEAGTTNSRAAANASLHMNVNVVSHNDIIRQIRCNNSLAWAQDNCCPLAAVTIAKISLLLWHWRMVAECTRRSSSAIRWPACRGLKRPGGREQQFSRRNALVRESPAVRDPLRRCLRRVSRSVRTTV